MNIAASKSNQTRMIRRRKAQERENTRFFFFLQTYLEEFDILKRDCLIFEILNWVPKIYTIIKEIKQVQVNYASLFNNTKIETKLRKTKKETLQMWI